MAKRKYTAQPRNVWMPAAGSPAGVKVWWNGRHGGQAELEIWGWADDASVTTDMHRIPLGTLLVALGITAEDCAAAIEATRAAESEQP